MIKAYIPSCNRACQVHLLLESMQKNAPGIFQPVVNYTYTNESFKKGYELLQNSEIGQKCEWQHRTIYGLDFKSFLNNNHGDLVAHFVDDMIYYRKTNIKEDDVRNIFRALPVWCFNLRVGLNIHITDYQLGTKISPPSDYTLLDNKYMVWNFMEQNGSMWDSYFNFEGCVDGFIFPAKNILWLLRNEDWSAIETPMHYERLSCHNGERRKHNNNLMASPLLSEVFAQHGTSVFNDNHRSIRNSFSVNELNDMYLNGYIIDIDNMNLTNINCAHDEIPYNMKRL